MKKSYLDMIVNIKYRDFKSNEPYQCKKGAKKISFR